MMLSQKEDIIKEKLPSFIEEKGFEVFEIRLFYGQGGLTLRVLVDYKEGGISVEECSLLSRKMSEFLDKESLLEESFALEVSSPGVDRQLSELKDFLRIRGKTVSLWLKEEFEGGLRHEAKVLDVDSDGNAVLLEAKDKKFTIPLSYIMKAKEKINSTM